MWKLLSLFLLVSLSHATIPTYRQDDGIVDEDFVWEVDDHVNWKNFMAEAEKFSNGIMQYIQPLLLNKLSLVNVSELCAKSLIAYTEGIKTWEPWAVQMVDSTAKLPSGILKGTKIEFGAFEECLDVRKIGHGKDVSFQGQFCMLGYKSPLVAPMHLKTPHGKNYIEAYGTPPDWIHDMMKDQEGLLRTFGLWLGVCIPSTCSQEDIRNVYSTALKPWASLVSLTDCQVDEPKIWPSSAKIAGCVLLLLCGVCLLGTLLDMRHRSKEETNENFIFKQLKYFSLYANSKTLFENNAAKSSLDYLHGLKFALTMWILIGHIFLFPEYWREVKYGSYGKLLTFSKHNVIFIENPFVSTPSFATLSGFLLVYSKLKVLEKNGGRISIIKFFLQKYFRLIPCFFFALLLLHIAPMINSGPIWNSSWEFELRKCAGGNWWKNLLLINNFSHFDDICLLYSWYISLSMQLQMFGLFLMILTYRHPKWGVSIGLSTILISFYLDYRNTLYFKYPGISINSLKDFKYVRIFVNSIYMKTWHHIPAFIVGMVLGWIMVKHKSVKLPKIILVCGWIMSIALYTAVMFAIKMPINDYNIIAIYSAVRNFLANVSLAWIMYCCMTGNGGFVNNILSSKTFVPFSQVSYVMFLIHPLIIFFKTAVANERFHMSITDHFFDACVIFLIALVISYIGHISVELPFNNLFHFLEKDSSKSTPYVTNRKFEANGNVAESRKQD